MTRTNIIKQNNNTLLLEGKLNNNAIVVGGDGNFSSLLPAFIYVPDSLQIPTTAIRVC